MSAAGDAGMDDRPSGVGAVVAAFVRNRVAAKLLMLFTLGGGLLVASGIDVAILPDVDVKRVAVTVAYPGSSPAEIEESVTRRIEERVIGLAGVRRVVSEASSEAGVVTVEVDPFTDTGEVLDKVRSVVDGIERFPPPDAERPEVALPWIHVPAVTLAVASAELSEEALRLAAERVREDVLALPSVSSVSLDRSPSWEIAIEVDEEALREHGLTIGEVARKVRGSSVDLTSGRLLTSAGGFVVRVDDRRVHAEEFEDIVLLTSPGGARVTVADVAEVRDRLGDVAGTTHLDGVPAIFITVQAAREDQTEVNIAGDVREMLAGYVPPAGVDVIVWEDRSRLATVRLDAVLGTGVLGLVLVFLVLALVFDLRLATWVAAGLPVSFLGALIFFPAFDLTLDLATVTAMLMMIGIVVDDAVVVGEGIATERERGLTAANAAVAGARRVFWPVTVGVVTTFLTLTPLLFTYGAFGNFMSVFPIVAGLVLSMSLAEAFLILPSHLSHARQWSRWPLVAVQARARAAIDRLRDGLAVPAVAIAIRRPLTTLAVAVLAVVVSAALLLGGVLRFGEVSGLNAGKIEATLTYPVGTPIEATRAGVRQLEAAAAETNQQFDGAPIAAVAAVVGHHPRQALKGSRPHASHAATVTLQLREGAERTVRPSEVARVWQRVTGEVVGTERLMFTAGERSPGSPYDLSLALAHPDSGVLEAATRELTSEMGRMPGVVAAFDSLTPGRRHFDVQLTPAGQAAGLTAVELAAQLRARFFGTEVQRIQRGRDEVKVMVRYPEDRRRSFAELMDERIELARGGDMPLAVAARVVESRDFEGLMRIDGIPAAEIGSFVDTAVATPRQLRTRILDDLLPELEARYPGLALGWARTGPDDDQLTLGPLAYTLPLVLLVIYALIAVQFRSYLQPLVVLTAMPLAAAGAVLAHLLLGYDMSLASVFGVVAVLGVVINDTLLLMDRYNAVRRGSEVPAIAALSGAVRERFRPILLTTVTTVAGLLPVLYLGFEATMANYVPMVVSLIGGLVAGSAGILFVVPAIVLLGEGLRERAEAVWPRRTDAAA